MYKLYQCHDHILTYTINKKNCCYLTPTSHFPTLTTRDSAPWYNIIIHAQNLFHFVLTGYDLPTYWFSRVYSYVTPYPLQHLCNNLNVLNTCSFNTAPGGKRMLIQLIHPVARWKEAM